MVVATEEFGSEKWDFFKIQSGAVLAPFEAFLVLRGIKTLALRMAETQ